MTITIPNWQERFETAQSRKVANITWTPFRHSFAFALRMNPPEVAAAMVQVVLLAASMPKRGALNDGGCDLTIEGVARCINTSSEMVVAALSALGARYRQKEGRKEEIEEKEGLEGRKEGVPSEPSSRSARTPSRDIDAVLAHYREYHPKSRPGSEDRKRVSARLREGYSVSDLQTAIDGNHRSPWHCGENPGAKQYHNLGLILRDSDHVRQFIEAADNGSPVTSERTARNLRAGDAWLKSKEGPDGQG